MDFISFIMFVVFLPDKHLFTLRDYGWTNEMCNIAYEYICKKPKREAWNSEFDWSWIHS